jgi:hypothetical protein
VIGGCRGQGTRGLGGIARPHGAASGGGARGEGQGRIGQSSGRPVGETCTRRRPRTAPVVPRT